MLDAMGGTVGSPVVITTDYRGLTPDELADLAMDKILSVSVAAPKEIREQALTYRALIRDVVLDHMRQAVMHDRVTIANALTKAGAPELASIVKEI
jgi:predicted RNA-binding protein with PUA domain